MEQELRLKQEAAERAFEAQAEKDRTLMRLEELATSTKDLDDDDAYWIKKQKQFIKNKMRNDLGDEDDEDEDEKRHVSSGLMSSGRTLPSKWEDAERWICSSVDGDSGLRLAVQQPQRRQKLKSGPLGPTNSVYNSMYSPAVHMFDGGHVGIIELFMLRTMSRGSMYGELKKIPVSRTSSSHKQLHKQAYNWKRRFWYRVQSQTNFRLRYKETNCIGCSTSGGGGGGSGGEWHWWMAVVGGGGEGGAW
ncbi:hypothetical protein Tco_1341503 [Tanacetum coccineum]